MKIEVTNNPDDLDELIKRGEDMTEFMVNLVTSRENPKKDPNAALMALDLMETYLDLLQTVGVLKLDINRALKHIQYQPEHVEN